MSLSRYMMPTGFEDVRLDVKTLKGIKDKQVGFDGTFNLVSLY